MHCAKGARIENVEKNRGTNRYGCYVQMSALFAVVLKMDSGFKKVDFNREKKNLKKEKERKNKRQCFGPISNNIGSFQRHTEKKLCGHVDGQLS